jgi:hypothetical protein
MEGKNGVIHFLEDKPHSLDKASKIEDGEIKGVCLPWPPKNPV